MLKIDANKVIVRGRPDDGETTGLFVAPDGFTGWDDGAEVRRDAIVRPGAHGEFDVPSFLGARVVGVDGWALAAHQEELGLQRSIITGMGATGGRIKLNVEHQGENLWAWARIGAKTQFRDAGVRRGRVRARWLWQMVCADPRKYGAADRYASGEEALNRGNFPATPVFTVSGDRPGGYTINGPAGRSVVVTRPLVAGIPHTYDMRTRQLSVGGVVVFGGVAQASRWGVPGGGGVVHTVTPGLNLSTLVINTYN